MFVKERDVEQDKEALISKYIPLIKFIAQRLVGRLPRCVSVDDLIHAGVLGLLDAMEKYDPAYDSLFKTYAEFRIRGAMLDALRALDWIPRSVHHKAKLIRQAYNTLEQQLGRAVSREEVAAFLGIDVSKLYVWLHQIHCIPVWRLNGEQDPFWVIQGHQVRDILAKAIAALPDREKKVVWLYYYEELMMKEIGKVMGITESRVSQIHIKATLRLQKRLQKFIGASV